MTQPLPQLLATERLLLRPFAITDVAAVHAYAGDAQVCQYLDWGPNTRAETEAYVDDVASAPPHRVDLAIVERQSNRLIGTVAAEPKGARRVEVGWVLHRAYWGQGYATEAASELLAFVAADPDVDVISARVRPDNAQSHRVVQKLGMRLIERIDRDKAVRGEWVASDVYEIDAADVTTR